jgi:hypothetical protein
VVILTADEILRKGLLLVGFDGSRQKNVKRERNIERFKTHFGSDPIVYAQIWEDLQMTDNPEACISEKATADLFLQGIHFLKCYSKEEERSGTFKMCIQTARKWGWYFARKIQALKDEKIVWPERWTNGHPSLNDEDNPIFIISVDGVHCHVNEPRHPTLSKNPKYYSHKSGQAGVDYELGISVFENRLVWMNGPYKASVHDITIFRDKLMAKIPAGKKVIGDKGYRGEKAIISTPNSHDPPDVRHFKSRARARQESFNSRIKFFACLENRFRHGLAKHKICFEAVCVIVQYQLENGSPLFDV